MGSAYITYFKPQFKGLIFELATHVKWIKSPTLKEYFDMPMKEFFNEERPCEPLKIIYSVKENTIL